MLTLVRHRENRGLFAVVGAGFGMSATARPGFIGGNLFPAEERAERSVVFVCDRHGTLGSFLMEELEIVLVDGVTPAEAIATAMARFGDGPADGGP